MSDKKVIHDALYQLLAIGDIVTYYSGFYQVEAIAEKPLQAHLNEYMIKIRLVNSNNRQKTVCSRSVVKIDSKVWTMYNLQKGK